MNISLSVYHYSWHKKQNMDQVDDTPKLSQTTVFDQFKSKLVIEYVSFPIDIKISKSSYSYKVVSYKKENKNTCI